MPFGKGDSVITAELSVFQEDSGAAEKISAVGEESFVFVEDVEDQGGCIFYLDEVIG